MMAAQQEEKAVQLTKKETLGAKSLWSEIFFEDSAAFTDYYFKEKMQHNTGYGIKKDGQLVSMLYLTPYTGQVRAAGSGADGFCEIPLSYIVGVGTKKEYRHRGYMDKLLKKALTELHLKEQPFTFLMPADPAIYEPYQFRYIYDRPEFTLCSGHEQPDAESEKAAKVMQTKDAALLAAFAQQQLKQRYQLFLKRDAAYYIRQQKESRAQQGDVYLWKDKDRIQGFYLYAKEENPFIQEAVAAKESWAERQLCLSESRKPIIMARITHVAAMLALLRLKQQAEREQLEICLQVIDPLLCQNNATFHWTVGKKESTIALVEKPVAGRVCAEISALTEFVFGRRDAEDGFLCVDDEAARAAELYKGLSEIEPISRTFLNEIV